MPRHLVGYLAWDFAENKPAAGTRRFKAWTTEREAAREISGRIKTNPTRYGVKPAFVEVEEPDA